MKRYLEKLDENRPQRSMEEYLGAFTESLKIIQRQNPVERMGQAVLLAAKTALRLKACMPSLKEHEIANRLQTMARNIRLQELFKDLTPEEKGMIRLNDRLRKPSRDAAAGKAPGRKPPVRS